ncbi:MAG: PQQ-binding-like beta-propeller repeat protein, partial [Acidobacteria bacterium]|nr:PQQ-binding-like beta-propeller repeat protein [Acidobacteriota bacterium]
MRWIHAATVAAAMAACLAASPAEAQYGAPADGEWRSYAGDSGSTKYSPLDQITADNFGDLEVRWHWQSVDSHLVHSTGLGDSLVAADTLFDILQAEEPDLWTAFDGVSRTRSRPSIRSLVATPLMVDGVLYVSTPLYRAAAIDARTGETLWVHDPRAYESGNPAIAQWRHRGVAYWENDGDARIVWATGDGFLIAVDAKTGIPAPDFGDNGRVDLMDGVPRATRGERDILNLLPLSSQSPPLVIRDTVIVGSTINDRTITREATPGFARAYDVRTGRHRWDFHTVPQSADEFGSDTWLDESWRYSGNTNIWSMMSGDEELGWVFLPIGTPTNDYYGGHRLGDNLFAESIVAVDVETGQRQWHFQTIHHGLWDYDLPAAPNLLDITVDGREIKAVAQVSKQGFVYVFDRITGEPVWPIEELPVATDTDLEGEILSPTQPFPTRPAAFEYQGTSIDDLVDFTPEIRQMAIDAVEGFRLGPLYTPQTLRGTIMRPPVG